MTGEGGVAERILDAPAQAHSPAEPAPSPAQAEVTARVDQLLALVAPVEHTEAHPSGPVGASRIETPAEPALPIETQPTNVIGPAVAPTTPVVPPAPVPASNVPSSNASIAPDPGRTIAAKAAIATRVADEPASVPEVREQASASPPAPGRQAQQAAEPAAGRFVALRGAFLGSVRANPEHAASTIAKSEQAASIVPATPLPTAAIQLAQAAPAPSVTMELAAAQPAPAVAELLVEHQLDMAADGQWLDQLAKDIAAAGEEGTPLRFRLNPETLGSLRVEVTQQRDGAAIG
jgi:hypothetical protein